MSKQNKFRPGKGQHRKETNLPLSIIIPSADDPEKRQPDISLAKNLLGWEPRVPLDEGLRNTIAYFEGLLKIPAV